MTERKGAALEYNGNLPRVLAVARGNMLEKMLQIAEEHNIPLYHDGDLAEVLSALEPGQDIPEDLFQAVARVLAFCYRINDEFKEKVDTVRS